MRKQKKQIIAMLLMIMVLLCGCGSSVSQEEYDKVVAERDALKNEKQSEESQENENSVADTEESEKMPDLSGNWEQEGKGNSYQAGYILGEEIEIYWITDDSKSLYWSGSYEAPTEKTDSFSWESKNNKEKTNKALLASMDDSKTFTYENGKISYQVSVQGVTQTVKLISTDTNYSESNGGARESEKEFKDIVLLNSGWNCIKSYDYSRVYYAVEISNPNEDYAIEFPTITITARDSDGKILSNDERVLNSISAGDTIIYGSDMSYEGDLPETVDISVSCNDRNYKKQDVNKYVKQSDFTIFNVSENNGMFKKYTGEIANNSKVDFRTVSISVIYKLNGEMVGGENGFLNDLGAGETKVFEISASSDVGDYDSYELYAIQW